jgi:hypothetical protein
MKNPFEQLKQSGLNLWKKGPPTTAREVGGAGTSAVPASEHPVFPTSILKDFVESITRKDHPVVLDIGPVIGSNVEFFFSAGIKIHMEDFLAAYLKPDYWVAVEGQIVLAEDRFFAENFNYPPGYFDGLVCWDLLNFMEPRFARLFVDRIAAAMKSGGLVMALFHSVKPIEASPLCKYRLVTEGKLEYIPLDVSLEVKRVYQTRDINQLFSGFQSLKFYLLKHNILEVLLKKE